MKGRGMQEGSVDALMTKPKSAEEIARMKLAGQIVADCHKELARQIQPGITTLELNDCAERFIRKRGANPSLIGYREFPYAICASVNDVLAHGFPDRVPLREGDVVKLDIVADYGGWFGDSAWCYGVGRMSEEAVRLMRTAKECLDIGISQATVGSRIGDVMAAVYRHARENGYSITRQILGHAIGRMLHEQPLFPHLGIPSKGFRLKEGMVITIEPVLNIGTHEMSIDFDGWTARTVDGKLSAQYEHTIAITRDGPLILTDQQ